MSQVICKLFSRKLFLQHSPDQHWGWLLIYALQIVRTTQVLHRTSHVTYYRNVHKITIRFSRDILIKRKRKARKYKLARALTKAFLPVCNFEKLAGISVRFELSSVVSRKSWYSEPSIILTNLDIQNKTQPPILNANYRLAANEPSKIRPKTRCSFLNVSTGEKQVRDKR